MERRAVVATAAAGGIAMSQPTIVAVVVITVVNGMERYLWPFLMSDESALALR